MLVRLWFINASPVKSCWTILPTIFHLINFRQKWKCQNEQREAKQNPSRLYILTSMIKTIFKLSDFPISSLSSRVVKCNKPKICLLGDKGIFFLRKTSKKSPCNIDFWIENDPPPLWNFSENSSDLVAPPFPKEY